MGWIGYGWVAPEPVGRFGRGVHLPLARLESSAGVREGCAVGPPPLGTWPYLTRRALAADGHALFRHGRRTRGHCFRPGRGLRNSAAVASAGPHRGRFPRAGAAPPIRTAHHHRPSPPPIHSAHPSRPLPPKLKRASNESHRGGLPRAGVSRLSAAPSHHTIHTTPFTSLHRTAHPQTSRATWARRFLLSALPTSPIAAASLRQVLHAITPRRRNHTANSPLAPPIRTAHPRRRRCMGSRFPPSARQFTPPIYTLFIPHSYPIHTPSHGPFTPHSHCRCTGSRFPPSALPRAASARRSAAGSAGRCLLRCWQSRC
jgi:hypothetical protein